MELRSEKNKRKPAFRQQDSWKQGRLKTNSWRKPKGMHSKIRMSFKGNPRMPSPGYKAPRLVRGLHPSGLNVAVISTPAQLELDKATPEAIIIAAKVGNKKRLEIIRKATEKKIKILNLEADKFTKQIEAEMAERKKSKQPRAEAAPAKPAKKEETKEAVATEEDKRKEARKDMEKIITKRD